MHLRRSQKWRQPLEPTPASGSQTTPKLQEKLKQFLLVATALCRALLRGSTPDDRLAFRFPTPPSAVSTNFRFGPLSRASYAPPALDTTNLQPEQPQRDQRCSRRLVFCPPAEPRLLPHNRVVRHCSDSLRPQILQPQSEFLLARRRQGRDAAQRLAKQASNAGAPRQASANNGGVLSRPPMEAEFDRDRRS